MHTLADMSHPAPSRVRPGWAVAGYGGGDTPYTWTAADWAAFATHRKLVIWTRSNPAQADPYRDAVEFDRYLLKMGVPAHCPVALDKETASDPVYLRHFGWGLFVAHRKILAQYESKSVYDAAQKAGPEVNWFGVADWTGKPHMLPKPVYWTQYASGTMLGAPYDLGLIRWGLWRRLWL